MKGVRKHLYFTFPCSSGILTINSKDEKMKNSRLFTLIELLVRTTC